ADETGLEGVDLIPFLTGKQQGPPHDYLYFRRRNGVVWSLVSSDMTKLIKPIWSDKHTEYYHLADDVSEQNDLITKHPEEAAILKKVWDQWNQDNIPFSFSNYEPYHKQLEEFYKTMPKK
ncbi:MAG: sulfatase, partial [Planctomycetota bacterium]